MWGKNAQSDYHPWLKLLDDNFNHHFYSGFRSDLDFYRLRYSIPDEIAADIRSAQENHKLLEKWPSFIQRLSGAGVQNFDIKMLYEEVFEPLLKKV